ncbi:MAG: inositol monophosphatase family protein [Actinomycetota bacterium]
MTLTSDDLERLTDVAIEAAEAAGEMIARSRPAEIEHKFAGASLASQVVTEIDRRSEAMIIDRLAPTVERFGLGLLTEERDDDGSRHRADHFWCVDPLDGTLPFIEGRPGSAVSIALVRRDGTPVIGVVEDLATGSVLHAVAGGGAFVDGQAWRPPDPGPSLTVFADRSLLSGPNADALVVSLERVAAELGVVDLRLEVGAGAVMNACGALLRPPGCYLKFPTPVEGGGSLWDFAATACLFTEVGAVASDATGRPLVLNRHGSTFMNHRGVLFASDPHIARAVRRVVSSTD